MAASVSGLEVFQIQLRKGYNVGDLRTDLNQLYIKAGLKNIGTVFLLTDAQVTQIILSSVVIGKFRTPKVWECVDTIKCHSSGYKLGNGQTLGSQ